MNNQRNSLAIILTIIVLLVSACGASATPMPIPPTATSTHVTPTFTPIPPTHTPTLEPTNTPTPEIIIPQAGHWKGEPSVTFNVTNDGQIKNFKMVAPIDSQQTCTVSADSITLQPDGTFILSNLVPLASLGSNVENIMKAVGIPTPTPIVVDGNEMLEAQLISGKLTSPTSINGTYTITACFNGEQIHFSIKEQIPDWSAEWEKP